MGASLLLASAAAGCFSRCFVHPMDTLRSRVMVSASVSTGAALRALLLADGVRGLYRGFGVSVVMQAPAVATYLSTYDAAKARIAAATGARDAAPGVHLAAGLAAETVSAVFWVPMEVIKQRAQVRVGGLAAASSAVIARDVLVREGARGLFKGYGLTLGVFGPYAMVYFATYERLKAEAAAWVGAAERMPTRVVAVCAAGAGAIAGGCTTPLDVIKTRMQVQGDGGSKMVYRGTWHAMQMIAREEGFKGFWRGFTARVLWIMPGTAITFSTFEFLKQHFELVP